MFARPKTVDEALELMTTADWSILSGGTDFYPALQDKPITRPVMDISAVQGWRTIGQIENGWRIGALSTWTDLLNTPLPHAFESLKLAAREVGSVQIQNRATVAGNLCNASPAADGVPPLLILDAQVELMSSRGTRVLPVSEFVQGNRTTAREPDELLSAIVVPQSSCEGVSGFVKLGARKYLVISIAMVAARVRVDEQACIDEAAVAVGACSAVAQRLPAFEQKLKGASIHLLPKASADDIGTLTPIDDIRASAAYRLDAVTELVDRTVAQAVAALPS